MTAGWFRIPYSKKAIEKEEKRIRKGYGNVRKVSEIQEDESLPDDNVVHKDETRFYDKNFDKKFDYSDSE